MLQYNPWGCEGRREGGSYFNAQARVLNKVWPGANQLTLMPLRRHPLALLSSLRFTALGLMTISGRTS